MELEATNGRRVRATVVFSHSLRFFRDTCLKELTDMAIADHPITAADIQWVITVPAIWRQSAKQFMRYAANEVHHILQAHYCYCYCLHISYLTHIQVPTHKALHVQLTLR